MTLKKNIIFVGSIPDDTKITISKIKKDGTFDSITVGSSNINKSLENNLFNCISVTFDTTKEQELPKMMIHGVFNEISDPDTNKIALQKLENFYKSAPANIPFFNLPSHIQRTTRDGIYNLLQGIDKLHVPKTVRIQPKSPSDIYDAIKKESFEYPVIFRKAGDHGGVSTIRVDNEKEQFYAFALDGRDYYLTQFVDYADENGIYTKYRLIVVDGEVYLRHVVFGKEWMVHARDDIESKENDQLKSTIAKNFSRDIKPKIQSIITEVYQRLELDYFGIDCSINEEMNLLVFEINANMNIFYSRKNSVFAKHVEKIRQALIKMLVSDRKIKNIIK